MRLFSINNLLGAVGIGDIDGEDGSAKVSDVLEVVQNYVKWGCVVTLSVCSLLVGLYAIHLGYKMAKAADDNARKEAKQRVIYAIIGMVACVAIGSVVFTVLGGQVWPNPKQFFYVTVDSGAIDKISHYGFSILMNIVSITFQILGTLATMFGLYIGWKFMSAADENKRKDVKMQLIFCVLALVAMVFIHVVAAAVILQMRKTLAPEFFYMFL